MTGVRPMRAGISLSIPVPLLAAVESAAASENTTRSNLIVTAIHDYLAKKEKDHA